MSDPIFMGNSRYSKDFQAVLDRSIAIASLPLTQMRQDAVRTGDEATALSTISGRVAGLRAAAEKIQSAMGAASFLPTVSDGAVATASISSGALEGSYTLEVTSLGAYTSTMSNSSGARVRNPATENIATSAFSLTVGSGSPITINGTSLNELVSQINAKAGRDVQASIVNVGSTADPDYRLAVRSRNLRAESIRLEDAGVSLLSELVAGAPARYKINGAAEQTSENRTINISPGVALTALKTTPAGQPVTVTIARSQSAINDALSSFATAYNSVMEELDKHRGSGKGALKGNALLGSVSDTLRAFTRFESPAGAVRTAMAAGLTVDSSGKMTVGGDTLTGSSTDPNALIAFLGEDGNTGFLKFVKDQLSLLDDVDHGIIKGVASQWEERRTQQDARITLEQERIERMRESLQTQLSAADALIASLEQQAGYVNGMFEAMRMANQQ